MCYEMKMTEMSFILFYERFELCYEMEITEMSFYYFTRENGIFVILLLELKYLWNKNTDMFYKCG